MKIVSEILDLASAFLAVVGFAAFVFMPPGGFFKGKYISRPAIKRFGFEIALLVRLLIGLFFVVALVLQWVAPVSDIVYDPISWVWNLWFIDDYLASRPKPKKRFDWSRVKIKMPAPIKLRQVERWKPVPAPAWMP